MQFISEEFERKNLNAKRTISPGRKVIIMDQIKNSYQTMSSDIDEKAIDETLRKVNPYQLPAVI